MQVMQWVLILALVMSATASQFSRQLCGTLERGSGIAGGVCMSLLAERNGAELPICEATEDSLVKLTAIVDLFSGETLDQLRESAPEAANLLSRSSDCVAGSFSPTWALPMMFYKDPNTEHPCGPYINYTLGRNAWTDYQFQYWYGSTPTGPGGGIAQGGYFSHPNRNQPHGNTFLCFDNVASGNGVPFIPPSQGYADSTGALATVLTRLTPVAGSFNTTTNQTLYSFDHCFWPDVRVGPDLATPQLVGCNGWEACLNQPNTSHWSYSERVGNKSLVNPVEEAQGRSTEDNPGLSDVLFCEIPEGCGCVPAGSAGSPNGHNSPSSSGRRSIGSRTCDGSSAGSPNGHNSPSSSGRRSGNSNPGTNFGMESGEEILSEMLQVLSLLQVETALLSARPWMDILAQMCSCACGPAF